MVNSKQTLIEVSLELDDIIHAQINSDFGKAINFERGK